MDGHDARTDGELLHAAQSDPEAFALFYRRHVRGMLAFFRRRVDSAEVAFDLTAETFAAATCLWHGSQRQRHGEPASSWSR